MSAPVLSASSEPATKLDTDRTAAPSTSFAAGGGGDGRVHGVGPPAAGLCSIVTSPASAEATGVLAPRPRPLNRRAEPRASDADPGGTRGARVSGRGHRLRSWHEIRPGGARRRVRSGPAALARDPCHRPPPRAESAGAAGPPAGPLRSARAAASTFRNGGRPGFRRAGVGPGPAGTSPSIANQTEPGQGT